MLPYFLILCIAWYLSYKIEQDQIINPIAAIKRKNWLIIILTLFIGFRYNVGADFTAYIHDYNIITQKKISELFISSEFGFNLLLKLCSVVYDSPTTMFLVCAAIFVTICINTLYMHAIHFSLSVVLFILCGTCLESCNAMRQSLAVAILLSSYSCIQRRDTKKYILLILLATVFHSSAIVMLPLYFILSCPKKLRKHYWLAMIIGFMFLSYIGLFGVAETVTGKSINLEVSYMTTQVNILRVLVAIAPCSLIFMLEKDQINRLTFPVNIVIINAVLMCVTYRSAYLARICMYPTSFLCLAIPVLLNNLATGKELLRDLKNGMLLAYGIFWSYGLYVNAGMYPYRTIFGF